MHWHGQHHVEIASGGLKRRGGGLAGGMDVWAGCMSWMYELDGWAGWMSWLGWAGWWDEWMSWLGWASWWDGWMDWQAGWDDHKKKAKKAKRKKRKKKKEKKNTKKNVGDVASIVGMAYVSSVVVVTCVVIKLASILVFTKKKPMVSIIVCCGGGGTSDCGSVTWHWGWMHFTNGGATFDGVGGACDSYIIYFGHLSWLFGETVCITVMCYVRPRVQSQSMQFIIY